ncbi:MAG TPA: CHRD domain-containing protein [Pyrinomonadaceae bacterium]|jgi:hypothetical protein|nr:CHRD domain-containing protein [Pyrinomonadaceae bacterium]
MKQPGVLVILLTFVAAVSFVVASEQYKHGRNKTTTLTGFAEVPTIGDPDGTGILKFSIGVEENQICYELSVSNIGTPTAAEISFGSKTEVGTVIATLEAPANGSSKRCVTLAADKIADLIKNPGHYYVNVYNAEFPKGAIRGQLGN